MDLRQYPLPAILVILGAAFLLIALLPWIRTRWLTIHGGAAAPRFVLGLFGALLIVAGITVHIFKPGEIGISAPKDNPASEAKAGPTPAEAARHVPRSPSAPHQASSDILTGIRLGNGVGLGANTSGHRTDWVRKNREQGCLTMKYPQGQDWGAVYFTVGSPKDPPRPSKDFSPFQTLLIEMKSDSQPEPVKIGIKTNTQPDDGSEAKVRLTATPEWSDYKIRLNQFSGTPLKDLYVVTEFVFDGSNPQTLSVRRIEYLTGE